MNVILVGASSSIGKAAASAFEAVGHAVVGTSRRDLDLLDDASIAAFTARCKDVDALVVLPGILPGKALSGYDRALADRVMAVNFTGMAMLVKAMLPRMREGGSILLMSSVSAERGSYDPIYAASKAAINGFVRALAPAVAPRVRVNAIASALVEGSGMHLAMKPERRALHVARTPMGRLVTLGEIAQMIVQVSGPAWVGVTGQIVRVDGGAAFI